MNKDILFDLAYFRPDTTNQALELLFKARQEGSDDFIWSPHESPLIRTLIELFTQRGLMRLESVRKAILRWDAQSKNDLPYKAVAPQPPVSLMGRWSNAEKELVDIYLSSLPAPAWELSDHLMALELALQTYMPEDAMVTEATWLAAKSTMMGKVQQNWLNQNEPTTKDANKLLEKMPGSLVEASYFPLSKKERIAMEFATNRAIDNVVALADNTRRQMRQIVSEDYMKRQNGDTSGPSLQSQLFDTFGELNRDWRRIAITEAGEAQLQGFIAGAKPGDKVKRIEQYADACPFCKKIHGVIATVVSPGKQNKDPDTEIWPGKNNIGRAAAPRKRVGGALVPRPKEEMYWLPAGLAHPHCRGRWVPVQVPDKAADPEFAAILAEFLAD
ncbi:hypothetical protein EF72_21310 [Salmonella enterica]|nr:hypothetical protein [Salmonella enterica]